MASTGPSHFLVIDRTLLAREAVEIVLDWSGEMEVSKMPRGSPMIDVASYLVESRYVWV